MIGVKQRISPAFRNRVSCSKDLSSGEGFLLRNRAAFHIALRPMISKKVIFDVLLQGATALDCTRFLHNWTLGTFLCRTNPICTLKSSVVFFGIGCT